MWRIDRHAYLLGFPLRDSEIGMQLPYSCSTATASLSMDGTAVVLRPWFDKHRAAPISEYASSQVQSASSSSCGVLLQAGSGGLDPLSETSGCLIIFLIITNNNNHRRQASVPYIGF